MAQLLCTFALVIAGLLPMAPAQAARPAPFPFQIEVLDEGQYTPVGQMVIRPSESTASGRAGVHEGMRHISPSREVEARLGAVFGFTYRVKGLPEGKVHGFEMRAIHPPMQSPGGKVSTVSSVPVVLDSELGEAYNDLVYRLSEERELLPGKWTLQILYRGNAVLTRDFTVR